MLGIIRLVNGGVALAAPKRLIRLLGLDPDANGAAIYVLRMFGVRTIYLGWQILTETGEPLEQALDASVFIHGADALAATLAAATGALPGRAAMTGAGVSTLNTALAILARRQPRP